MAVKQSQKVQNKEKYRSNNDCRGSSEFEHNTRKTDKVTIKIKKKDAKLIIAVLIIAIIGSMAVYTQTRRIEGAWVRTNDDNGLTGMVVTVNKSNNYGEITLVANNDISHFRVGEQKWTNIKKIGWGKYSLEDLTSDGLTGKSYNDGSKSIVSVSLDGKTLTITHSGSDSGSIRTGYYQVWNKKDD